MTPTFEALDGRTYFNAGGLDSYFGTNGLTRVTVPYTNAKKEGGLSPGLMAVDAAGRTVVASLTKSRLVLRRFDAFGAEDSAFTASAAAQPIAYAGALTGTNRVDLAVDPTNRIYLLSDKTITRFTSSGKIDRSFGTKGSVRLAGLKEVADLDVGADGQVWAVGSAGKGDVAGNQMRVVRLTADGVFDDAFADHGVFTVPVPKTQKYDFNGGCEGAAVKGNADGSVRFVGQGRYWFQRPDDTIPVHYNAVQVVTLDAKGRLVKTYGTRGIATQSFLTDDTVVSDPNVLGIRPDGGVVVGDSYETDSPNPPYGGLSTSVIDATGTIQYLTDSGLSTILPGAFLPADAGGTWFVNPEGLTKLKADGTADTSFNAGKVRSDLTAAAIAGNGGLVFASTGGNATDAHYNVGRLYTADGPSGTVLSSVLSAPAKAFTFDVVWQDADGVTAGDLTGTELRVRGPDYYAHPVVVGLDTSVPGQTTATYALRLVGGKKWTAARNGVYTVTQFGTLPDDSNGNASNGDATGSLVVKIA